MESARGHDGDAVLNDADVDDAVVNTGHTGHCGTSECADAFWVGGSVWHACPSERARTAKHVGASKCSGAHEFFSASERSRAVQHVGASERSRAVQHVGAPERAAVCAPGGAFGAVSLVGFDCLSARRYAALLGRGGA